MKQTIGSHSRHWLMHGLLMAMALGLHGCSTAPQPQPATGSDDQHSSANRTSPAPAVLSQARNARDYRQDAARHLYARQSSRIYPGRLPPMLYAVGVLHVEIDQRGQVHALQWQRAPRHAPEVMAEIERMVRAAAPYPAPVHMPKVTYTDVWLWDKSERFQLDTLTQGQD